MASTRISKIVGPEGPEGPQGPAGPNTIPTQQAVADAIAPPLSAEAQARANADATLRVTTIPAAKNTAIVFGTSLENQGGLPASALDPAGNTSLSGRGWWVWLVAYSLAAISIVRNAGIGGNRYDQMRARIDTDVLAYASDWVFMGGPVNDVAVDRSAADIIADMDFMLDKLAAAGRRVLILTAGPSANYNTSARRAVLATVNRYIAALPQTRRNVVVADAWKATADPVTGSPATGMAVDDIHWSGAGAARVGLEAWNRLRPHIVAAPPKVTSLVDPASWMTNPTFNGPGTGWAIASPATGVTVTWADEDTGWAKKPLLTFAGVTDGDSRGIQYVENASGGKFAPGEVITLQARIKWSSLVPLSVAALCTPFVRIQQRLNAASGSGFPREDAWGGYASGEARVPVGMPTSGEVVAQLPRITVLPNVDKLYVTLGFRGAASVNVEVSDVVPTNLSRL